MARFSGQLGFCISSEIRLISSAGSWPSSILWDSPTRVLISPEALFFIWDLWGLGTGRSLFTSDPIWLDCKVDFMGTRVLSGHLHSSITHTHTSIFCLLHRKINNNLKENEIQNHRVGTLFIDVTGLCADQWIETLPHGNYKAIISSAKKGFFYCIIQRDSK